MLWSRCKDGIKKGQLAQCQLLSRLPKLLRGCPVRSCLHQQEPPIATQRPEPPQLHKKGKFGHSAFRRVIKCPTIRLTKPQLTQKLQQAAFSLCKQHTCVIQLLCTVYFPVSGASTRQSRSLLWHVRLYRSALRTQPLSKCYSVFVRCSECDWRFSTSWLGCCPDSVQKPLSRESQTAGAWKQQHSRTQVRLPHFIEACVFLCMLCRRLSIRAVV